MTGEEKAAMTTFEKKRLFWARLGALASTGVFLLVLALGITCWREARMINATARQASEVINSLNTISAQLEKADWETMTNAMDNVSAQLKDVDLTEIVARLDTVSRELAAIDWADMAANVDDLTVSARASLDQAQVGLDEATKAVESLDIETLNSAIRDLQTVIEPLAKLMGSGK